MRLKTNGLSLKMSRGAKNGLPALILAPEFDTNTKTHIKKDVDFLASLLGAELEAEDVNNGPFRRVRIKAEGVEPFMLQSHTAQDTEFLDRLTGMPLLAEPADDSNPGCVIIRPDPAALSRPRPEDKYMHLSLDDLLDLAARRGIALPRNTLKADAKAVLAMHEKDPAKAQEMAKAVKPSKSQGRNREQVAEQGVSGGSAKATTYNEV